MFFGNQIEEHGDDVSWRTNFVVWGCVPFGNGINISLKVGDMASYLLRNYPEVLLGGDTLETCGKRCRRFWENYKTNMPSHKVFQHFDGDDFERIIPICIHGDKGRTLKKSPIANYSWESVWGLPPDFRDTAVEPGFYRKFQQKYDVGRLGQTCGERSSSCSISTPCHDQQGTCSINLRRLGTEGEADLQKHNSLGVLV